LALSGVPLAALMAVPVPAPIAARIISDLLAELPAEGRGDVSPQSVLVGEDGIARLSSRGAGSRSYRAPEQISRKLVDLRADLFAVGVLLHELVSGRPLFTGSDEGDLVLAILFGDIPKVDGFDDVLGRALARDREERFRTAAEMKSALDAACASPNEVADWVKAQLPEPASPPKRRWPWLVVATAVLVIGWFATRTHEETPPTVSLTSADTMRSSIADAGSPHDPLRNE
jgi:serine/threonine protein kinase